MHACVSRYPEAVTRTHVCLFASHVVHARICCMCRHARIHLDMRMNLLAPVHQRARLHIYPKSLSSTHVGRDQMILSSTPPDKFATRF
jgi:hypothetical protein